MYAVPFVDEYGWSRVAATRSLVRRCGGCGSSRTQLDLATAACSDNEPAETEQAVEEEDD
jgi:hypothetical protein